MKKFSKHTPEQNVAELDKAADLKDQGMNNGQVCRELGVSESTLARWREQYGSMNRTEAKQLKALREENSKLKQLLAESELDKTALRELAEGKF